MRERRIFLNIAHVPKIWGVPYPKVFITVGLLIFSTVGGNALSGGAGTMIKIMVAAGSVLLAAALHIYFMLTERVDKSEQELSFIKNEHNSQSSSLQRVKLLPKAPTGQGKSKK